MNIFDMKNLCYGGDYNPEQWINYPEIWDEDMRLMKLAHVNCVSLGIFSWASVEREEGVYDFSWLDKIIDKLWKNGVYIILATPSGARPAWLSQKYPEVLRLNSRGLRNYHGRRHNHCASSPKYRERVAAIDRALSERYGKHPAVVAWHISNEYSGRCFCPLCAENFRGWLKERYGTLDELNNAWWSAFWSHTYTDWTQIEPPMFDGETSMQGLNLDWKRFCSDLTIDFFNAEVAAVREFSDLPVTTNFLTDGLNFGKFSKYVDFVSWDNYPRWHNDYENLCETAALSAFYHDMFRSFKAKPHLMLESTPSNTNWQEVCKLKEPGLNALAGVQAIAHGSEGVMYFQWRKSRGSYEKFHGAVVDHEGSENTRVFREVAELGGELSELRNVKGSYTKAEVAVIYDLENGWAVNDMKGLKNEHKGYLKDCLSHYRALQKLGANIDVIDADASFDGYKLVVAPMLYMVSSARAARIREYIGGGGVFAATYLLSYVNETDLCHLGGFPGGLKDVFGIWNEEIDALYKTQTFSAFGRDYEIRDYMEAVHVQDAEVLGEYKTSFMAGMPALTVNRFGAGKAYYIAARAEDEFLSEFYSRLVSDCKITRNAVNMSDGVYAVRRGENIFVMNFSEKDGFARISGEDIKLPPYGYKILTSASDI